MFEQYSACTTGANRRFPDRTVVLFAMVFALLVTTLQAYAQDNLNAGMFPPDVITSVGPPDKTTAMEARREVLWSYPWGSVKFKEGRLLSWQKKPADMEKASNLEQELFYATKTSVREQIKTKEPVDNGVFPHEILSSLSEDEDPTSDLQSKGGQRFPRKR